MDLAPVRHAFDDLQLAGRIARQRHLSVAPAAEADDLDPIEPGVVQLVVATQDHKTWKEIGDRWGHRNVGQFLLVREDALAGTEIRNHTDDLAAMIARAQPFINSADPLVRKDGAARLRDAIERFGKMVVVRDRKAAGDNTASITDYDGQNFGNYSQKVYELLSEDPSHPGKLRTAHNLTTPARTTTRRRRRASSGTPWVTSRS